MVDVTQADIDRAKEWQPDHELPEFLQLLAAHRQAALLEGIRMGIDATAECADDHGRTWGLSYITMTTAIADAIRAIDPAAVLARQMGEG